MYMTGFGVEQFCMSKFVDHVKNYWTSILSLITLEGGSKIQVKGYIMMFSVKSVFCLDWGGCKQRQGCQSSYMLVFWYSGLQIVLSVGPH